MINAMITAGAKKNTDNNAEKAQMNQDFINARQKMIEERTEENRQHQEALELKTKEIADRAKQYEDSLN